MEVRIETGLQELRTIIEIQPPLERSQRHDAQLKALEKMKGRGM